MTRVALADVGRRGRMELTFAVQSGRTVLRKAYCEVPFKVTRILEAPIAHLILMHSTAGVFGGDDLECVVRLEPGARVRITQQSATKAHPSEDRVAKQRTRVWVDSGAELELYLEPLIPFADSRLRQETQLNVEAGGVLSYWEGFMTGRVGRGESWQFRELASETQLRYGGRLVYLDRFELMTGVPQRSRWILADASYTGIGLRVGADARQLSSTLHEALPGCGVDALTDNVLLTRVVSAKGPEFHRYKEIFEAFNCRRGL